MGSSQSQLSQKVWITRKVWITQHKSSPASAKANPEGLVHICSWTDRLPHTHLNYEELWEAFFSPITRPSQDIFLGGTDCEPLRHVVAWIHLRIPFFLIITISIYGALDKCQMLLYTLHIYLYILNLSRTLWNKSYDNPHLRWGIKGKERSSDFFKVSTSGRVGIWFWAVWVHIQCSQTLKYAYSALGLCWGAWKVKMDLLTTNYITCNLGRAFLRQSNCGEQS